MLKSKTRRTVVLLALTSLLLYACGTAGAPEPTTEPQQVVEATPSPSATPAPPQAPTPEEPTSTPLPEPSVEQSPETPPIAAGASPTAMPAQPKLPDSAVAEIRPVEEVSQAGSPTIVEITANDAVLLFESSIPLACSVVYGETTDYGQIAVDQDMDGGAHTDHQPLLLGLKPDTEYHYRVQGTAADGTLYLSEDRTFRTLSAEPEAEVNLASLEAGGRVIAVSSNFGGAANDGSWGANSAVDGLRGTAWSSNGDGNDAFLEIELSQTARLSAVEVWTRSMSDGTAQIFRFALTTDAGEVLGPFALDDASRAYRFAIDAVAHTVRLDVLESSGGNTGLVEFAIYGRPVEN